MARGQPTPELHCAFPHLRPCPQAQLNAAGREASRRLGLHVIDLETMVAGIPPPMYLEDHFHVSETVFWDVGNVLLNAALRLNVTA